MSEIIEMGACNKCRTYTVWEHIYILGCNFTGTSLLDLSRASALQSSNYQGELQYGPHLAVDGNVGNRQGPTPQCTETDSTGTNN